MLIKRFIYNIYIIEYSYSNNTIKSSNGRLLYPKAAATTDALFEQYENDFWKEHLGENKCVFKCLCYNKVL